MATGEGARLVVGVMQSKGDVFYMLAETPLHNGTSTSSLKISPSRLSTLTSAVRIQHNTDLDRLQRELENVQKDLDSFQQKASENLRKVEGKLSYLMDVVSDLENRNHNLEQWLMEEEGRGVARSQVLTFLLPREKELRDKCGVLEKALFKNNAWQTERLKNIVLSHRGSAPLKTAWGSID